MDSEQLEAVIWQTLTLYARRPLAEDVQRILAAAEAHAARLHGITAHRRAILAEATQRKAADPMNTPMRNTARPTQ